MPTKIRKKAASTVTLVHPSGRFEVEVREGRAAVLEERGYTRKASKAKATTSKAKTAGDGDQGDSGSGD